MDKSTKDNENWQERFRKNLNEIKKVRNESLIEFASELGVAKSTMQSVLWTGNTTLNTAVCIANALNISIDKLINTELGPDDLSHFIKVPDKNKPEDFDKKMGMIKALKDLFAFFVDLDEEQQEKFKYHLTEMLKLTEMLHINEILEAAEEQST